MCYRAFKVALKAPDASRVSAQDETPIQSFVTLELANAHKLITSVDDALRSIKKVLYGTGLLTPAIQKLASDLLAGSVPTNWESRWGGPDKPQSWLRGLVVRKVALMRWAEEATSRALLDKEINLAELFNPGTFLNALRQQTARLTNHAMDKLQLVSSWSAKGLSGPKLSVR
jgi:dynein heavy chain 2